MNIFYLDHDPVRAAQYHCDKHVVKMILETAQLLSTAHRVIDGDEEADAHGMYKATHRNHPSAVWVREAGGNYLYTHQLFRALLAEYTYRYGKKHKTGKLLETLSIPPFNIPPDPGVTPLRLAMPDEYKLHSSLVEAPDGFTDAVASYRAYYQGAKANIARWDRGPTPDWWGSAMQNQHKTSPTTVCRITHI